MIEMDRRRQPRLLTRRTLLTPALLLPAVAACGRSGQQDPSANTAWSFTDDRGLTISLPKRPERVVAYVSAAAALWDYGIQVVGTSGPRRLGDGSRDPRLGMWIPAGSNRWATSTASLISRSLPRCART